MEPWGRHSERHPELICDGGKKINKQWEEYSRWMRDLPELINKRQLVEKSIAELKEANKKRFYNFLFYASLLYIVVLVLKYYWSQKIY